jgi:ubiquinone biosynthesis monooxygenase Coq7
MFRVSTRLVSNQALVRSYKTTDNRPLTDKERQMLDPLIRVDQAGEVGAYYIYKGQMAVLGNDKN